MIINKIFASSWYLPSFSYMMHGHTYSILFLSATNKMRRYTIFFIVVSALHVSSSESTTLAVADNKFDKYPVFELLMMSVKAARNT